MSLEDKIKDARQLLQLHIRYLQKCREQQAIQGIATPPGLLIEIEDREKVVKKFRKQLKELEKRAKQGLGEPETISHRELPKKTFKLTNDTRISLKQMLIDLILDYFLETDDIEVKFDSTQKIYSIVLSKGSNQQQDDTREDKRVG